MLNEIYELVSGSKALTVTNVILAFCIIFHLFCEFVHYIHEFISRRRQGKELKANGAVLKELKELVERIEKTQNSCSQRKEREDASSNEKVDDSSSSPL